MPVIQVNNQQHTLKPGQTKLGAGPGVDVSVSENAQLGLQAVMELGGDNRVVIRRARDGAMVKVNGVVLGIEPTPLMHGDKIDVSGTEVLFSEDKKVGATQFVSAADVAAIAAKRAGPARATANTGGRLVSLVDGKEYQIGSAGLFFGREAGSDIVVAQPEVSRRHASIAPNEQGYVLQDLSTNGVWVNGNRVQGSQVLSRADVIRVGGEEFRFYADVASAAGKSATPTPSASAASVPAQPVPAPSPAPTPVAAAPVVPATPVPAPAPAPVAAATAPRPAPPPPAPRVEPPTAPKPAPRSAEPPTAPAGAKPAPKPRKEAVPVAATADAGAQKKGGGVWIWVVLAAVIIAVIAYFVGQGRG